MNFNNVEFKACAVSDKQCPTDEVPEIALIGRSNVGKSSLINKLVHRKGIAKTSSVPGKTRTINFYGIDSSLYLVDLPGYGYAKAPLSERKSWKAFVESYLESRPMLCGAIIILDVRRDIKEAELNIYSYLENMGLKHITVLTKTDKLSANKVSSRVAAIKKSLPGREFVLFSSISGKGKDELIKKITATVEEHNS
ncbi:MAG: YihA family ribosome biogenesis GTP-binding protein [Deltaproteobacteria bacterium]|nr:YihA family ribosome biogenesis GTP-binding protein [Deltaproteobacteria bacterium]